MEFELIQNKEKNQTVILERLQPQLSLLYFSFINNLNNELIIKIVVSQKTDLFFSTNCNFCGVCACVCPENSETSP